MRTTSLLLAGLALAAYDGAPPVIPDPPVETAACIDLHTLERCSDDDCTETPCRGDELCSDDACAPWTEVDLWVDFDLTYDDTNPQRITCKVLAGGLPRDRVQALRFDFGDGITAWSEWLTHDFDAPGIYPVVLEVRLEGMRTLRASRTAVIPDDTGAVPDSHVFVTLNEIPEELNGSLPFTSDNWTPDDDSDDYQEAFHLLLPQDGFTIDVTLFDNDTGPIDLATLAITTDVDLGGGAIPAGTDLVDRFEALGDATDLVKRLRWNVANTEAFPASMVTLTLDVADQAGEDLPTQSLLFEVTELTPELDPFDRPMVWLLRFDQDFFSTTATEHENGAISLDPVLGGNDEADFIEELRGIGAQGDESGTGAGTVEGRGKTGANAVYARWVVDAIIAEIYRYYAMAPDGTPREQMVFTLVTTDDPGAPDPADFDPAGEFSIMRFGGFFDGALGWSGFGVHNQERVDDSSVWRGVASASLITPLVSMPVLTDEFTGIKPTTGTRVGEHDLDATVLADGFDRWDPDNDPEANARYDDFDRAARFIGLAIAAVAAHEMGHAMGLVPNGPPPGGFFGNRADCGFVGPFTDLHHVDLPGLNLMQAGGDFVTVVFGALDAIEYPPGTTMVELALIFAGENRLSPYARAYFNRALIYNDF